MILDFQNLKIGPGTHASGCWTSMSIPEGGQLPSTGRNPGYLVPVKQEAALTHGRMVV